MQTKKYYIGLDIGTNSVGWAVSDEEYNLCRFKGKDMWGIRLFEAANTAEERRIQRNSRRRLQRQHQRIALLQELFAEEMAKVDQTFFIRLNESRLHLEDKSTDFRHPLFCDRHYTDIDYHKEYPTIYHLRKTLIENKKGAYDIRLVYLALHHILKHRGHFLVDGDLKASKSFTGTFEIMCDTLRDNIPLAFEISSADEFESLMKNRSLAKSTRAKGLEKLFTLNEEDKNREQIKREKNAVSNICKLLVGNKGDFAKVVQEDLSDLTNTSFKFTDLAIEEIKSNLATGHVEASAVFDAIKALYDWSILVEILNDEEYISFAKVKEYEIHRENLVILRTIIRKYCSKDIYNKFFNDYKEKDNYVNYIGQVKKNGKKYNSANGKCSTEEFYSNLKKLLKSIENNIETVDKKKYDILVNGTEFMNLLPLQRSKDNSVVPRQVNELELETILENAKEYLTFLQNEEDGISVCDKIISIFNFRIPYYVGPLSRKNSKNAWMVRKEEGYIYPWNFSEKVDESASNEAFIRRMTNKCTYLLSEDVVPKNSILYSKFMVLNELNNLKIRGKKPAVELKQKIFNDLFLEKTKVTGKTLLLYLKSTVDADLTLDDLSGFDKDFKSNMNSYLDFKKKIYLDDFSFSKIEIAENIIRWITIYDSDSKMIKQVIKKNYPNEFNGEQLKAICKFRYSGWGNFSEKFLSGIEGTDIQTGEISTIMGNLWNTNNNLMQLLSSDYSFTEQIKKLNCESAGNIAGFSYETLVDGLYVSPANKRAIWQTLQIVNELVKIMGHEPEKIFVEMARSEEKKGDAGRTSSRKSRLLQLYAACEDDSRDWTSEIESEDERKFNSKKLFLYYTQMGKCMYTGENIDIDDLMMNNSKWDIDHIFPQSKIMDDSLDNLVLVSKKANEEKGNNVLQRSVQQKMRPFWTQLMHQGFISKKKYERLCKTGEFTEEELTGFIARQLVETRQSSKAVAELLGRMYTDTKIVYVKANLVSRFRNHELMELKSRRVNDYHHAKDAYLNIVVGNVYNEKFTDNPAKWIRKNKENNYSLNRVFYYDLEKNGHLVWKGPEYDQLTRKVKRTDNGGICGGSIDVVRTTMRRNNIRYTEYSYCDKGQLFDIQAKSAAENATIPLKKGLDVAKYGGYKSANTSYFALIEFDGKKGERTRQIIGVPMHIAIMMEHDNKAFTRYCEENKGLRNVIVLYEKIKKNALLQIDGFPMRIRGENENNTQFKLNVQLILDPTKYEIVRRIEKYLEKRTDQYVSTELDGFDKKSLLCIYDEFIYKLSGRYYNRPANQADNLRTYREAFADLELSDMAIVINQMLSMLRCDVATTANLKLIGGGSNAGNISINKNTIGRSNIKLVNQSITGLYENKTVLTK